MMFLRVGRGLFSYFYPYPFSLQKSLRAGVLLLLLLWYARLKIEGCCGVGLAPTAEAIADAHSWSQKCLAGKGRVNPQLLAPTPYTLNGGLTDRYRLMRCPAPRLGALTRSSQENGQASLVYAREVKISDKTLLDFQSF